MDAEDYDYINNYINELSNGMKLIISKNDTTSTYGKYLNKLAPTKEKQEEFLIAGLIKARKSIESEIKTKKELKNKQRDLITQKFREFLNMLDCSEASIWAVIVSLGSYNENGFYYYAKKNENNLLLEKKLINKFAQEQEIRYDDSVEVIRNFINIRPINQSELLSNDYRRHHEKIAPIFFDMK
jgi:hypothetical protein